VLDQAARQLLEVALLRTAAPRGDGHRVAGVLAAAGGCHRGLDVARLGAHREGEARAVLGALDGGRDQREQGRQGGDRVGLLPGRFAAHRDRSRDRHLDRRGRPVDQVAQRLGAFAHQQAVRIVALGQHRRAHAQARRQQDLEGAQHRALAGGVAVEEQDHGLGAAPQPARVVRGERGATGGQPLPETRPAQRDLIEIALHHDRATAPADRLERRREAVECLALAEDRALGRVQVLGLLLGGDGTPPEAQHTTAHVLDREEHAASQPVVVTATLAPRDEARLLADLEGCGGLAQEGNGGVPGVRGEADLEALRRIRVDAPLAQVGAAGAAGRRQRLLVVPEDGGVGLEDLLGDATACAARFRHLDAAVLRQAAHRLHEGQVLGLHQEGERVSSLLTAEAVEALAVRIDVERRGLLVVERAEPFVAPARTLQVDGPTDEFDHVYVVSDLLDDLVRDAAQCPAPPVSEPFVSSS
jgi:hypothetical protein